MEVVFALLDVGATGFGVVGLGVEGFDVLGFGFVGVETGFGEVELVEGCVEDGGTASSTSFGSAFDGSSAFEIGATGFFGCDFVGPL